MSLTLRSTATVHTPSHTQNLTRVHINQEELEVERKAPHVNLTLLQMGNTATSKEEWKNRTDLSNVGKCYLANIFQD